MANTSESKKLKFASLEEAKEYLLQCKEQNVDVSQKAFLDAVSALNLDDDTMDDLYNWIDENLIEFIDGDELDEDEVLDDDLSDEDLDEEDSIAEEISQLEKTFANASHAKINDPVKMYLKEIGICAWFSVCFLRSLLPTIIRAIKATTRIAIITNKTIDHTGI